MSTASAAARNAGHNATHHHGVKLLGRVGLAAYGLVNLLLAYLAIKIAMGDSGKSANKNGALSTLAEQTGGKVLLWIIVVGLVALTLWQIGEAIWGHAWVRDNKKRTQKRVISGGKALLFGLLAFSAGKVAAGSASGGSKSKTFTAKVLELPGGQFLVGLIGVAIVAIAAGVVFYGLTKRFAEDLDFSGASASTRKTTERLGQVGYAGVGVAYVIVGFLVVVAAVQYDPEKASGLDTALKTLAEQPFGAVLLWIVALALACYGVYCFFDARFHRG